MLSLTQELDHTVSYATIADREVARSVVYDQGRLVVDLDVDDVCVGIEVIGCPPPAANRAVASAHHLSQVVTELLDQVSVSHTDGVAVLATGVDVSVEVGTGDRD